MNNNTRITLSRETKRKLDNIKLICGKSYETIISEMIANYKKIGYDFYKGKKEE